MYEPFVLTAEIRAKIEGLIKQHPQGFRLNSRYYCAQARAIRNWLRFLGYTCLVHLDSEYQDMLVLPRAAQDVPNIPYLFRDDNLQIQVATNDNLEILKARVKTKWAIAHSEKGTFTGQWYIYAGRILLGCGEDEEKAWEHASTLVAPPLVDSAVVARHKLPVFDETVETHNDEYPDEDGL